MQQRVQFWKYGGPEVLQPLPSEPLGEPLADAVLVRHTAIGVNFTDTYHRTGVYPVPSFPSGIGVEAAGTVEAVGPLAPPALLGKRVAYAGGPLGAYADARLMPADRLVVLPEDMADSTAAAGLLKGMTAEYLIRRVYAVQPGETVVVHGAAGGVGLILCQWLQHVGATVIGIVGTGQKAELARANGCTYPVVVGKEDFVARVRELTAGIGVGVVYDSVGKDTFESSLNCLKPRGLLVCFGNASGKPDPFDVVRLAEKGSLFLTRPTLFHYTSTPQDLALSAQRFFDVVANGSVKIHVGQHFSLEQAADAHRALEARQTLGSTILVPAL